MSLKTHLAAVIALVAILASGCARDGVSSLNPLSESVPEIAGSTLAGIANSTESSGSMGMVQGALSKSQCPKLSQATCSGSTITLNYDGCSFESDTESWNGSEILTFDSGACTTAPQSSTVTFTRTFAPGTTNTDASGVVVALDTTDPSGYATQVSGGTTIVAGGGNRTVTINGIHYVANQSVVTGSGAPMTTTLWDHTVSTPAPLTITGSGPGQTIQAGTIEVQHNLRKFIGSASITQPLTFTAGCCFPTGGQITATFSGSKTGTQILNYSAQCGSATLIDDSGDSSAITLSQCL